MELLELITRVRSNIAELDSDGYFSDDDITSWLNKAQYNIAVITRHLEEKETLSVSDGSVDLPGDVIEIFLVEKDGRRIDEIAIETRNIYTGYYEWNDKLYIAPDDYSGDVDVYYFRTPVPMEQDSDEPEVPEEHEETMVIYALYRACQKDQMLNKAQMYQAHYMQDLHIMRGLYPKTLRRKMERRKFGDMSPLAREDD